jgi:hypothetical protein
MSPGRTVIALLGFLLAAAPVLAQTPNSANVVATCGTPNSTYSANQNAPVTQDTTGKGCVNATVSANIAPATGTPTQTSVSCATGSTTLLAAAAATQFILIKVPAAATVPVWFNFAGAAAVAAPPSVDLAAGASINWTAFVPTAQINCLATSATTVTIVYK